MISPEEIQRELLIRGCSLRPGAPESLIKDLELRLGSNITPYAKSIYNCFDGFIENTYDPKSHFSIWSLREIIEFNNNVFKESAVISFGDRFVQSDFLTCDITNSRSPVRFLEGRNLVSDYYEGFWYKLLNSEFDIEM